MPEGHAITARRDSASVGTPALSAAEFKSAMALMPTQVSIIATDGAHGMAGLTCSAVCSVTDSPPTVLACVHGHSSANAVIKANGVLSINCLGAGHVRAAETFAGAGRLAMVDRFELGDWHHLASGAPRLADAPVTLECRLASVHEVGTHSVLLATVEAVHMGPRCAPLVYHSRAFATTQRV